MSVNDAARPARQRIWGRVVEAGRTLLSFEMVFLAFIFASNYKASAVFAYVPVDMTVVTFLLSGLIGLFVVWSRWRCGCWPSRQSLVVCGVGLLLFAYPSVSLLWSPGVVYARQKALYVTVLNGWGMIGAALVIGQETQRLSRFFCLWASWALFLALAYSALAVPLVLGSEVRVGLFGANYQTVGVSLGYGLSILLVVFWCWSLRRWQRLALGVVIVWMFWLLLENSSRMALLGSSGMVVLPILIGFRSDAVRWVRSWRGIALGLLAPLAAIGGCVIYRWRLGYLPTGITRMARVPALMTGRYPEYGRYVWMGEAYRFWLQRPVLGHGCGAFPLLLGRSDARAYPHNIVMEVLCELGAVGFLLLSLFHWVSLRLLGSWKRLQRDRWRVMILALFLCTLAEAMVSYDLPGNRPLFMMLGLCAYGATSYGLQPSDDGNGHGGAELSVG